MIFAASSDFDSEDEPSNSTAVVVIDDDPITAIATNNNAASARRVFRKLNSIIHTQHSLTQYPGIVKTATTLTASKTSVQRGKTNDNQSANVTIVNTVISWSQK